MMTELYASLAFTVAAQTTGIGTYPGTTGKGQCADAGASGTTVNVGPTTVGGAPATPYAGMPLVNGSVAAISVQGVFVATINLDRSRDGGATWKTVKQYTAPAEETYQADTDCLLRLWCGTGNYTSGAPALEVAKG